MVTTKNLSKLIGDSIRKAQKNEVFYEEIYSNNDLPMGKNEFLFFIKPEITLPSEKIDLPKILDLVQDKLNQFGLNIHNVKLLSAEYLDKFNIISQHYGVINKIASNATAAMSASAKEKFESIYNRPFDSVKVLGGVEFLKQYQHFNEYSLDYLWQNVTNKKLAGGTYCEEIKLDDELVFLINGFHPRQLKHFTAEGRSIVVMTLSGDLTWADARNNFIGATNPESAKAGSIRRTLLDKKEELGLPEVSQGVNGVHLSAGPVEALVELRRYNSNFSNIEQIKQFDDFSFGKKLSSIFTENQIEQIVGNTNAIVDGKQVSIFDLTEEKDSDDAISILREYIS